MKGFLSRHNIVFNTKPISVKKYRQELEAHGCSEPPLSVFGDVRVQGYNPPEFLKVLTDAGLATLGPETHTGRAPLSRLQPQAPVSDGLVVAGFLGDALTAINARTGSYLGANLQESVIETRGCPRDVESIPQAGTFACTNHEAGTVTFFKLEDGSYLHGDHAGSTKSTGGMPLDAHPHPYEPILYVGNGEGQRLTAFDAVTGDYLNGSLENSSFTFPNLHPAIMTFHPKEDILYVRIREGGVAMFQGRTMLPLRHDLDASIFPTRYGFGLSLSEDGGIMFVPETPGQADGLAMYDPLTGIPSCGTHEASLRLSSPTPMGVTCHPDKPIVYLACMTEKVVELRDGRTGEYLFGSSERSTVRLPHGSRDLLVDPRNDIVYATCFDGSELVMFEAATGAYRFGSLEGSTLETTQGPRAMALLG